MLGTEKSQNFISIYRDYLNVTTENFYIGSKARMSSIHNIESTEVGLF